MSEKLTQSWIAQVYTDLTTTLANADHNITSGITNPNIISSDIILADGAKGINTLINNIKNLQNNYYIQNYASAFVNSELLEEVEQFKKISATTKEQIENYLTDILNICAYTITSNPGASGCTYYGNNFSAAFGNTNNGNNGNNFSAASGDTHYGNNFIAASGDTHYGNNFSAASGCTDNGNTFRFCSYWDFATVTGNRNCLDTFSSTLENGTTFSPGTGRSNTSNSNNGNSFRADSRVFNATQGNNFRSFGTTFDAITSDGSCGPVSGQRSMTGYTNTRATFTITFTGQTNQGTDWTGNSTESNFTAPSGDTNTSFSQGGNTNNSTITIRGNTIDFSGYFGDTNQVNNFSGTSGYTNSLYDFQGASGQTNSLYDFSRASGDTNVTINNFSAAFGFVNHINDFVPCPTIRTDFGVIIGGTTVTNSNFS